MDKYYSYTPTYDTMENYHIHNIVIPPAFKLHIHSATSQMIKSR